MIFSQVTQAFASHPIPPYQDSINCNTASLDNLHVLWPEWYYPNYRRLWGQMPKCVVDCRHRIGIIVWKYGAYINKPLLAWWLLWEHVDINAIYRGSIQMTSTRHKLNLNTINCCIPGLLSKCGAGVTWAEQSDCRFAIKSSFADKCMYYNEPTDRHCDCLDAQTEAMAFVED